MESYLYVALIQLAAAAMVLMMRISPAVVIRFQLPSVDGMNIIRIIRCGDRGWRV